MSSAVAVIIGGSLITAACGLGLPFSRQIAEANQRAQNRFLPFGAPKSQISSIWAMRGALTIGVIIGVGLIILGASKLN